MTELASVSAAVRFRQLNDALQRRDQVRIEGQRLIAARSAQVERRQALVETDLKLAAQRLQDLRDTLGTERARQDQFRAQARTLDIVADDNRYQQIQHDTTSGLNAARDAARDIESLRLRDIAGAQGDRQQLDRLRQRDVSFRQQQVELDARVAERRAQDRAEAVRQDANLQTSINRIRDPQHTPDIATRGALLDVTA